jgi:hypothetical protein
VAVDSKGDSNRGGQWQPVGPTPNSGPKVRDADKRRRTRCAELTGEGSTCPRHRGVAIRREARDHERVPTDDDLAGQVPRPLTQTERAVIERLLGSPFPGSDELLAQLRHTVVDGGCRSGCATISLSVDRSAAAPAPVMSAAPVSADISDGVCYVVLLVDDGFLSCLEVHSIGEPVRDLPQPGTISPRPAR